MAIASQDKEAPRIGTIETVRIRDVWPKEATDFTPWLKSHMEELDGAVGLGLKNPRREVSAGAFSIDLLTESDYGDVVIENQYGASDHRHLGQLTTYLAARDVEQASWIVERARPEHAKAVEMLNDRGAGKVWLVELRVIRIGASDAAPLFTIVVGPSELGAPGPDPGLSASEAGKLEFLTRFVAVGSDASPFRSRTPNKSGILSTPARGQSLLYQVAVNRGEARIVLTNRNGKWQQLLLTLLAQKSALNSSFAASGLSAELEWPGRVNAGHWAIRYTVNAGYADDYNSEHLRELNLAAERMKRAFDPCIHGPDAGLEDDTGDPSDETDER